MTRPVDPDVDPDVDPGLDLGVDLGAVLSWLRKEGVADGPLGAVTPLGGGTQNVMLRLDVGGRDLVLRRGPRHLRPRSNDAMRREVRVLGALAGTDVPHPRLVAACTDERPALGGAVTYVMEPVEGFNPAVEVPEAYAADPGLRHRGGLAVAEALAALGSVDHQAVGLGDLGRPEGFLERQVPRWLGELDSYAGLEGYADEPRLPHVDELAAWLEERRPQHWTPGLIHGDFHLANVMLHPAEPRVAAVVDWEMCTVGDPLMDLGALVATWYRAGDAEIVDAALARAGGVPTTDELVAAYAARSRLDVPDVSVVGWYVVMACFKLGIVLEGTYARSRAGLAPAETGERLHAATLELLRRAREVTG